MFSKHHLLFKNIGTRKNLRDELLLVNPGNSSSFEFVNSWQSDYNKCTNVPFVYQLALQKYHEPLEDLDVDDNYDPSTPKWVDMNYPRTFVYDDAHVNVLEEALPFKVNKKRQKKSKTQKL